MKIIGKKFSKALTNLESGNNDAIIIVINTFIFASCWTLLHDVVVKS